jgi:hypothetical protein
MGFLDQIKQQAEAIKQKERLARQPAFHAAHTASTEGACATVTDYFSALAQQLNVLKPISTGRYVLDRANSFTDLPQTQFRVDARRKAHPQPTAREADLCDHVVMQWTMDANRSLTIEKDFISDIEKLLPKLHQCGARFDSEDVRDPGTRRLKLVRYTLEAKFLASVYVEPLHNEGLLHFKLANLDSFGNVTLKLPANQIHSGRLDELAKWIVGQPHRFFEGALELLRTEA